MRQISENPLLKKKKIIIFPLPRSAILLILRIGSGPFFNYYLAPF